MALTCAPGDLVSLPHEILLRPTWGCPLRHRSAAAEATRYGHLSGTQHLLSIRRHPHELKERSFPLHSLHVAQEATAGPLAAT